MSEYWVCNKRPEFGRIKEVLAMEYIREDKKLKSRIEYNRSDVIKSIENNNSWFTSTLTEDNKRKKGAEIHVVSVENEKSELFEKFIRTDRKEMTEDNLGDLPTF